MNATPLGSAIRTARLSSGMSIREFARCVQVDHSTLSRWESGRSVPTRTALTQLLSALPIDIQHSDEIRSLYQGGSNKALPQNSIRWNGELLRAFRRKHQLDQKQFADACGVHQGTVSKWERDLSVPSAEHFAKLENALQGSPLANGLHEICDFAASIQRLDTTGCFESYSEFWQACRHFDVPMGEIWGVILTDRLRFLAKKDYDAMRVLSWTYASRIDWMLVRGREKDVFQLAFQGIRDCKGLIFDFSGSNIFALPSRLIQTKRRITKDDLRMIEMFSKLANKYCSIPSLPTAMLVASRHESVRGNHGTAERMLQEAKSYAGNYSDLGQMGQQGRIQWIENRSVEQLQFAFRSGDYDLIESTEVQAHWSMVSKLMVKGYRLAAQTKLSRPKISEDFANLKTEASALDMEFAFETIVCHINRMTGIDLNKSCLI